MDILKRFFQALYFIAFYPFFFVVVVSIIKFIEGEPSLFNKDLSETKNSLVYFLSKYFYLCLFTKPVLVVGLWIVFNKWVFFFWDEFFSEDKINK